MKSTKYFTGIIAGQTGKENVNLLPLNEYF